MESIDTSHTSDVGKGRVQSAVGNGVHNLVTSIVVQNISRGTSQTIVGVQFVSEAVDDVLFNAIAED